MNATQHQFDQTPEQIANRIANIQTAFPFGVGQDNIADWSIDFDRSLDDEGVLHVNLAARVTLDHALAIINGSPLIVAEIEAEPESEVEDDEAPFLDHTDQVAERMIEDQEAGR